MMGLFEYFRVNEVLQNKFTNLEKAVLEQYISVVNEDSKRLCVQLLMSSVESRVYTNVGFKTTFLLPEHVPTLSEKFNDNQANIYADHPKVLAGTGFMLATEKGLIKSLNGFVFVGRWPKNESEFRNLKLDYCPVYHNAEAC